MVSSFVLDTHALIWYLEGNKRLGQRARKAISSPESHLVIPIIALAEAGVIIEQHRTKIPSTSHLLDSLLYDPRFEVYPLNIDVLRRSLSADIIRIPELHDRLIVATALFLRENGLNVGLITRDESITNADLVRIVW